MQHSQVKVRSESTAAPTEARLSTLGSRMDSETVARLKSQGKWGSACTSCASAKAKCLRSSDVPGVPCDRCQRLFKDCTNQIHHPRKKRASKPSRTAQLEERLNGLVDLLRATGEIPTNSEATSATSYSINSADTGSSPSNIEASPLPSLSNRRSPRASSSTETDSITVPKTYNSFAPSTCICRAEVGEAPAQTEPDANLFAIYQHHLCQRFPFVIAPPATSPAEFRSSRPFLFSCITMVASFKNMQSMRVQMFLIMQRISDHMLMQSERSLDLLQGIIVVLGWYQNHCMIHAQLVNLISLATGLLADMGLNRQPEIQERTNILVLNPDQPLPRTNEERRALLGVWYLSSSISVGFQKTDPMRFSTYIQRCLRELESANECNSDRLLIQMVRIQHLTQKIHEMNIRADSPDEVPGIPKAPVAAYQRAFQGELDRIHAFLSDDLKENELIICALQAARLHLYEPPIIDAALLESLGNSMISGDPNLPSALDVFYLAKAALRTFYDHWFNIPISSYLYLPLPVCMQLIYAITMLSRWAKLLGPGHSAPIKALPPQKPLFDPSTRIPLGPASYGAGLAPPPDFASKSTPSQSHIHHDNGGHSSNNHPEVAADASLSDAIAVLKTKLQAQPDLSLDIIGILGQIHDRFEQVNQETSKGAWKSTIWDLGARKVLITRAKLERWAEMIASGGSISRNSHQRDHARVREDDQNCGVACGIGSSDSVGSAMEGIEAIDGRYLALPVKEPTSAILPQGQASRSPLSVPEGVEDWQSNAEWSNDLFDQIDPSLWFDDTGDWGTIAMHTADNSSSYD